MSFVAVDEHALKMGGIVGGVATTSLTRRTPASSVARSVPERTDRGCPRWLQTIDRVHLSAPSVGVLVADAVFVWLGVFLAGLGVAWSVLAAASVVAACLAAGVYVARDTVETKGVLWYPPRIAAPLVFVALASVLVGGPEAPVVIAVRIVLGAGAALVLLRGVTGVIVSSARRHGLGLRRALVVGSQPMADKVIEKLLTVPEAGLLPIAVVSPSASATDGAVAADELARLIVGYDIDHVVLLPEGSSDPSVVEAVAGCEGRDIALSMVPPLADLFLNPSRTAQVGGLPLISLGTVGRPRRSQPGKRALDIVVASAMLLVTLPLMLVTALAILLDSGRPIFFRQRRVGRDGEPFEMLKFRSMVVGAHSMVCDLRDQNMNDGLLFKVAHDPRVTRIGRLIRRLSIDELPQLLNVLAGDMSMVGPRPLPVDPDDFGPMDGKRHIVRPGITGYWQISGGNQLSYQEMVKLDLAYVQNWSLWCDVRLLLETVPALAHRRGPC